MNSPLTLTQKIKCERLAHVALCHFTGIQRDRLIAAFWKWLNLNREYDRREELKYILDILLDFPKQEV